MKRKKTTSTLNKKKSTKSQEPCAVCDYAEVFTLVYNAFDQNALRAHYWISTINPLLGDVTPIYLIHCGRGKKLLSVVKSLVENQGL